MATYHGRKGVVYLATTGSGNASNVVSLTQWTLNAATDKVEVTAFGDANKTYVQGLKDLQGTIAGFFNDTEAKPWTASDSSTGCKLYLYPSADAAGIYWYGPAWLDCSIDTGVSGAIAITASFAANGSWGRQGL